MAKTQTTVPEPGLDLDRARDLFEQVLRASPADETEMTVHATVSELTRFANNIIHQNVADQSQSISIRTVIGGRMARASTNRIDTASIREVVERAVQLTRLQQPDPDVLPMPGPQNYLPVHRYDAETAGITPELRAGIVRRIVDVAEQNQLTTAGVFTNHNSFSALFNSRGLAASYHETGAEYSVTMLGANSSGWAKGNSCRLSDLDPIEAAHRAAHKALASADPIEIPPGKYTVILEPAAVLDLLGFLFWDFGGLAVLDQRSFLSDRVGAKLFGDNIDIVDDAYHALQTGAPFDGEGIPRQAIPLVEKGVIKNLVYARQTAEQMKKVHAELNPASTGHGFPLPNEYGEAPLNIVVAGGNTSVDEMIASTGRGILVTRLWYIREVDPYQKILTGMTRDGTFLVEDGKVTRGLRNFRFNQNMVELLNQVEMMSPSVRSTGEEAFDMVVPAMKVKNFNFTEVTRF